MVSLNSVGRYLEEQRLRSEAIFQLISTDQTQKKLFKFNVPIPRILPTNTELSANKYSSSIASSMIHFANLAYDLSSITYPNDTAANNAIKAGLPKGAVIKKLLVYSCSTVLSYYYSYGGFIIEYTVGTVKSTIIVLRGTQYNCEWYEDSKVILTNASWIQDNTISVHTGYNNIYAGYSTPVGSLRNQINSYLNSNTGINNLIITGHSLGMGLGLLLFADIKKFRRALSLNTKVYGFSTPFVGNKSFINLINPNTVYTGLFLFINVQDPVAVTTPPYYARPTSQLFCFLDKAKGVSGSHYTTTYADGITNNYNLFNQNSNKSIAGISCSQQVI